MRRPRAVTAAALVLALALSGSASGAQVVSSDLGAALRTALAEPGADARQVAALVVDLRSGKTVLELGASRPLRPASTEKLAVSYAALAILGPRYRFRTSVVGTGERARDTWRGDLYLVGGGDPTLTLRDLDRLARRVAALGIRRVTGRVLGDESLFDAERAAPGWKATYLGEESPPVSALAVRGVDPPSTNASAAVAARAFATALARHGVLAAGTWGAARAPEGAIPLAEDASPPLRLVVRLLNRDSDNLAAELVLKALGASGGARGSFARGAALVRATLALAGVPLAGVRVVDGSGLSLRNRMTARALVAILRAALDDPSLREPFVSSLAVAGVSGTLERRLDAPPTRGRVRAKTGTTSRASALAGYVGRRYAFSILENGSPVSHVSARAAQDRVVALLARP
ncbi:MAG: D-alanyl-D-alanine carboxypeptidase/D-alanyl-D-alanine-endopeptidase [Gaiellaceae bacterium]|nr:D-alanyl-D-alanine carboxypeptidase/D-alanyl-D-alanine-endopeptidase [Gaiellaceae bacterium]